MSSDPKIKGIKTYLFENFSHKKRLPKLLGDLLKVKILLKWANVPFSRCSKRLGEVSKQDILQQMFRENSRSQIVLRTDIFRKLSFGAPVKIMSQVSISLFMFQAGFPVFAIFQDELEVRKSLRAFCLQPKS